MSTIFSIVVYDGSGRVKKVMVCDQKCYRRNSSVNKCICDGRNRRAGKAQAIINTNEWITLWYADWLEDHRGDYLEDDILQLIYQLVFL